MPLSRNLGALNSWNPLGLSRPKMGLIYLLPTHMVFTQLTSLIWTLPTIYSASGADSSKMTNIHYTWYLQSWLLSWTLRCFRSWFQSTDHSPLHMVFTQMTLYSWPLSTTNGIYTDDSTWMDSPLHMVLQKLILVNWPLSTTHGAYQPDCKLPGHCPLHMALTQLTT